MPERPPDSQRSWLETQARAVSRRAGDAWNAFHAWVRGLDQVQTAPKRYIGAVGLIVGMRRLLVVLTALALLVVACLILSSPHKHRGARLKQSIWVGSGPSAIVVAGERIFVGTRSGLIVSFNARGRDRQRVKVGASVYRLAVAGNKLVFTTSDGRVGTVDRERMKLISIRRPARRSARRPLLISAGNRGVWIASLGGRRLMQVRLASLRIIRRELLPGRISALVQDDRDLWAALRDSGSIARVDERLRVREVRGPGVPVALAIAGSRVWVASARPRLLWAVRRASATRVRSLEERLGHPPISLAAANGAVWAASAADDAVVRVGADSGRRTGLPVAVGVAPIAVAANAESVWTADSASGTVTRIDLQALSVLKRGPVRQREPSLFGIPRGTYLIVLSAIGLMFLIALVLLKMAQLSLPVEREKRLVGVTLIGRRASGIRSWAGPQPDEYTSTESTTGHAAIELSPPGAKVGGARDRSFATEHKYPKASMARLVTEIVNDNLATGTVRLDLAGLPYEHLAPDLARHPSRLTQQQLVRAVLARHDAHADQLALIRDMMWTIGDAGQSSRIWTMTELLDLDGNALGPVPEAAQLTVRVLREHLVQDYREELSTARNVRLDVLGNIVRSDGGPPRLELVALYRPSLQPAALKESVTYPSSGKLPPRSRGASRQTRIRA